MFAVPKNIRRIQTLGKSTREWILDWHECRAMWDYGIVAMGLTDAGPGFRVVAESGLDIVMVCCGGRGRFGIGRDEVAFGPGQVALLPQGQAHAYRAAGQGAPKARSLPWRLAWVCYRTFPLDGRPMEAHERLLAGVEVSLVNREVDGFVQTLQALRTEMSAAGDREAVVHLAALVDLHTRRLVRSSPSAGRLDGLWRAVEADPGHRWTLGELAERVGMSAENLRLVCREETGRSPIAQVTHLRMVRARAMLAQRQLKLSAVASAFGYENAFSFSTAFRRHAGVSPREVRRGG
jgi:AraC-like DNA-binding protein